VALQRQAMVVLPVTATMDPATAVRKRVAHEGAPHLPIVQTPYARSYSTGLLTLPYYVAMAALTPLMMILISSHTLKLPIRFISSLFFTYSLIYSHVFSLIGTLNVKYLVVVSEAFLKYEDSLSAVRSTIDYYPLSVIHYRLSPIPY
jgi:hypothetical protein